MTHSEIKTLFISALEIVVKNQILTKEHDEHGNDIYSIGTKIVAEVANANIFPELRPNVDILTLGRACDVICWTQPVLEWNQDKKEWSYTGEWREYHNAQDKGSAIYLSSDSRYHSELLALASAINDKYQSKK